MPGDLTLFRKNAVNYYGVFLKGFDTVNPFKDKLTIVRKNYYESGLQTQKRKFTDMSDDGRIYKYNYCLNEDTVLKWKVVNTANRVLEKVPTQRDGDDYRVEIRDNFGKINKIIYFGAYHNWKKTKYFGDNGADPVAELVYWDKNGMAAILKYTAGGDESRPEVLVPCRPVDDQQLLQKLTDKLGVPEVSTLCSNGYVYFANDRFARRWDKYCDDPSQLEDEDVYDPFPDKVGEQKKIDLTQTDDVIVPEMASGDNLIFNLSRDDDNSLPSRKLGDPEMPKLHSDALFEDSKEKDKKKTVFDLLYSSDEKDGEDDEDGDDNAPEDKLDANEKISSVSDDEDEEDDSVDEFFSDTSDDEDDDLIEDDEPVSDKTREFQVPAEERLATRSYGYKRARPSQNDDTPTLDERASQKTIEFMKQSISDALKIQNDMPSPPISDKKPISETKPAAEKTDNEHIVHHKAVEGTLSPAKTIRSDKGEVYYYYGDTNDDGQRHGKGRTSMHDDLTAYDGEYAYDKRDGFGAYYYSNGQICYVGDWSKNRRNGIGVSFRSKDRSMYVGKWENDCPVGMGAKFDENGDLKFVGRWESGSREGVGMLYNPDDESVFISRWVDDKLSEKGTLFDSNGNLIYNGEWKNGKRNGIGTQYDSSGQVSYHGEWKDGKFNGEGVLALSNGCRVSGSFVMGTIDGYAVFTTKRGKKLYEGQWVRNHFHGEGKKFDIKTGSWYQGSFADGRPVGILSCFDRDGNLVYKGELRHELYHGDGIGYKDGEMVYDGEWKNGVRYGTGTEYNGGILVYKGKFKENVRRGIGTSYTADGKTEYSGHWSNDRKDGEGLLYKDGKPYLAGNFTMGVPDGRINEVKDGVVVKQCIYSDGKCVYMREFTEDGLSVKYEGYVKNGIYEGMGCGFSQYGEKYFEGIFKDGKPFKSMKVKLHRLDDLPVRTKMIGSEYSRYVKGPNYVIEREFGSGSYSGLLVNGRPYGKGTIIYTDHGYTGSFEDGSACGLGVIYEWNGSEVKGTFVKEASKYTTEITFADGVTYHILNKNDDE